MTSRLEMLQSSGPPSNSLVPIIGKGFFELIRCPLHALCVVSGTAETAEDSVRCAALGAEVPGHLQKQLTQTLIVCLYKTLFYTNPGL